MAVLCTPNLRREGGNARFEGKTARHDRSTNNRAIIGGVVPDDDGSLDALAGESYLYLTTTGRRTGRAHEIEIWFALDGRSAYLLSGGGDRADWVRNLRVRPACGARIGGREFASHGRILERGTAEDERARGMLFEKYQPGYSGDLTEWRATALAVALDLT